MQTVKHKFWGTGIVINKEVKENGTYITVRFDKSGKEMRCSIPLSFQTDVLVAEGDLKEEVDIAIQAKKAAEQAAREARVAHTTSSGHGIRSFGSSAWATIVNSSDTQAKDAYEAYLINKGYADITIHGAPSTVPQYVRAVESVLQEEHLTWSTLKSQIATMVALYGEGGAKEELGNRQHKTIINALKRFEEFC